MIQMYVQEMVFVLGKIFANVILVTKELVVLLRFIVMEKIMTIQMYVRDTVPVVQKMIVGVTGDMSEMSALIK